MISAQEALERLKAGNQRFAAGKRSDAAQLSHSRRVEIENQQRPFAIILGCSDSRVPAELVFDQGLGDLFVIRVAGNIVAPSLVGSIEFAAERFGTRLVVVLGHSQCGAIQATLDHLRDPSDVQSENLRSIIDRVRPSVEPLLQTETEGSSDDLVQRAVRANVAGSVDDLRHSSEILKRLIRDEGLRVVGSEYSLETGRVEFFDEMPSPERETRVDTDTMRDRPAIEPPPQTAYHFGEGESEWYRLGALDKAENVVRLAGDLPHSNILDVGAGDGSILSRLAELGFGESHSAIDVSQSGIDTIRGRGLPSLVDCRTFDGEHIPYADGQFDLAILSHVIEHVEHPRKLLYEAARVAQYVFVEVPLEHNLRLPRDFVADSLGHINAYTETSVRRLLQSCGLEVLEQIVANRSRATYAYHGDHLGGIRYWTKELALRAAPGLAKAVWTYHCALICRSSSA